jgi:hypothetical protein
MLRRAICPHCKLRIKVRQNGTFYIHRKELAGALDLRPITDINRCIGSHQPVKKKSP